jgi:hypothetical protein
MCVFRDHWGAGCRRFGSATISGEELKSRSRVYDISAPEIPVSEDRVSRSATGALEASPDLGLEAREALLQEIRRMKVRLYLSLGRLRDRAHCSWSPSGRADRHIRQRRTLHGIQPETRSLKALAREYRARQSRQQSTQRLRCSSRALPPTQSPLGAPRGQRLAGARRRAEPQMSGYRTFQAIRRWDERRFAPVPGVMITPRSRISREFPGSNPPL